MPSNKKPRLKMLEPRLKVGPTAMEMRLKPSRKPRPSNTGRDADPRRVLPLNGAAWQKLRADVLAEQPLCVDCASRGTCKGFAIHATAARQQPTTASALPWAVMRKVSRLTPITRGMFQKSRCSDAARPRP